MSDESIFAEALAISDTAAREEYLERACAGDSGLRREVDALLATHAGENLLDRPFQVDGETLIKSSASEVGTFIVGRH